MPTEIFVSPLFDAKIAQLTLGIRPALVAEMDLVMLEAERIARSEADWLPDGTVVTTSMDYQYEVTGASRRGIVGYALGTDREVFQDFSYTDGVTSSHMNQVHRADPSVAEPPEEVPGLIQGVLTMYEDHAGFLQRHERGEYPVTEGVSPSSPLAHDGQQVTTRVLREHASEIVGMLQAGAAMVFEGLRAV